MYRQFRIVFTGVEYIDLPMGFRTNGAEWMDVDPEPEFLANFGSGGARGVRVDVEGFAFHVYFHAFEITSVR